MVMHEGCGLKGASEDELRAALAADGSSAELAPGGLRGSRRDAARQPRPPAYQPRAEPPREHPRVRLRPRQRGPARGERQPARVAADRLGRERCVRSPSKPRASSRSRTVRSPSPSPPPMRSCGSSSAACADRTCTSTTGASRSNPDSRSGTSTSARSWRPAMQVKHVAVGDRVLGCFQTADGDCFFCRRGLYHRCAELPHLRPRGRARVVAGHPGRDGPDPQRRPRAAEGSRGHEPGGRALRRRRDGHRLPRDPGKRHAARRPGGRARPRTRWGCARCRSRAPPARPTCSRSTPSPSGWRSPSPSAPSPCTRTEQDVKGGRQGGRPKAAAWT